MSQEIERPSSAVVTTEQIVDAALALLMTDGLEAVTMRKVAGRLGVSPMPLYDHLGNKEALLDEMAARVTDDFVVEPEPGEAWAVFARRWCLRVRERRLAVPDNALFLRAARSAMSDAASPLVTSLRAMGVAHADAIHVTRLLIWSTLGHVAVELGHTTSGEGRPPVDADQLFADHLDLVIGGLAVRFGLEPSAVSA